MKTSSKNNTNEIFLADDAILTPMAVLVSGKNIISLIAKTLFKRKTHYTMLVGPAREATGWVSDDIIVTTAVAKHKFIRLPAGIEVPKIIWGQKFEDVQELEKWLVENNI